MQTCSHCHRTITDQESKFVAQDKIICFECHNALLAREKPLSTFKRSTSYIIFGLLTIFIGRLFSLGSRNELPVLFGFFLIAIGSIYFLIGVTAKGFALGLKESK